MRISHCLLLLPLAALAGCAHSASAPPPQEPVARTTTTTSATLTVSAPSEFDSVGKDPNFKPDTEKLDVARDVPIDAWTKRYPDAAKQLGDWMRQYPDAAAKLSAWDASRPTRLSTLIDWAVTHRYESIESFLYGKDGWSDLAALVKEDHDAMFELMDWMRRGTSAAEELGTHRDALSSLKGHLPEQPGHEPTAAHAIAR